MEARIARWCLLLGVKNDKPHRACFWDASDELVSGVAESRVIEQDVMRTRAEINYFRSDRVRRLMKVALLRYCAFYKLSYMQGLNEILAPLMAMVELLGAKQEGEGEYSPPRCEDEALSEESASELSISNFDVGELHLSFVLFERIVERLAPVVFASEGVQALQGQLASFHLLLYYFDADLHGFLSQEGMTTNVYAQSWFITLFARRSPLPIALRVLDHLLEHLDKPHITIFLGVALLLHNKQKLAALPIELIPETLVRIQFVSEEEVDVVFERALQIENLIPPSAVREVRRVGFDASMNEAERAPGLFELMYRPCLTVSAADIAKSMCDPGRTIQYLIIDSRPAGGGRLPCVIQGSLPISTQVITEIWVAQQSSRSREPNLAMLSSTAAATLALLRACRAPHVHIAICGEGAAATNGATAEAGPTPTASTSTTGTATLAPAPVVSVSAASTERPTPSILAPDDSTSVSTSVSATVSASATKDTSNSTKPPKAPSVSHVKREEAKRENMLPQNQLANALLVLGFSHVCVLKGVAMSASELQATWPEGGDCPSLLPEHQQQLQGLRSALCSRTDGFAALVYSLLQAGCNLVAGGGGGGSSSLSESVGAMVEAPHDPALAEKIARHLSTMPPGLSPRSTSGDTATAAANATTVVRTKATATTSGASASGGGANGGAAGISNIRGAAAATTAASSSSSSSSSNGGNSSTNAKPSSSLFDGLFDAVLPKPGTATLFSRISSAFAAAAKPRGQGNESPTPQGDLDRAVGADTEL